MGSTVSHLHYAWSLQGLFVHRWNNNGQAQFLMQLFLISSGSGLTLNSLSFAFLGLSLVVLSVKGKNFVMFHISSKSLQLQYVYSGILETNISCIEASLFFIIAIVICTQKKTTISFSFATVYLTVCCVY